MTPASRPSLPLELRVGISYCRVSKDELKRKAQSLAGQSRINEQRAHELGIRKYSFGDVDFQILDDGRTGRTLHNRDAIQLIVDLIRNRAIGYLFVTFVDRLARSSKTEALHLVGVMADHGVRLVTESKVYNTGDREDREAVLRQMFEAERESDKIGQRSRIGKIQRLMQGQFVMYVPPFGTRRVVRGGPSGRATHLRYVRGAPDLIRAIYRLFLKVADGSPQQYLDFTKACNRTLRREWTGRFYAKKLRRILSNRTYRGFYLFGATASVAVPEMNVLRDVDLDRVDRLLPLWGPQPGLPNRQQFRKLTFQRLLEISGSRALDLAEGTTVQVVCRNPACRNAQLKRVDLEKAWTVKNGGKAWRGLWLQLYECTRCHQRFFAVPPRDITRLVGGTRCMWCGTPNDFEVNFDPYGGAQMHWRSDAQLWKVKCRKCESIVYLSRNDWFMRFPFSKFKKVQRSRIRSRYACMHTRGCDGRCEAIHLLHGRGYQDAEIAQRLGISPRRVQRIRLDLGLPCVPIFDERVARRLHRRGFYNFQIAEILGVAPNVIDAWRQDARLPVNPARHSRQYMLRRAGSKHRVKNWSAQFPDWRSEGPRPPRIRRPSWKQVNEDRRRAREERRASKVNT